jgi:hypothetical protein
MPATTNHDDSGKLPFSRFDNNHDAKAAAIPHVPADNDNSWRQLRSLPPSRSRQWAAVSPVSAVGVGGSFAITDTTAC